MSKYEVERSGHSCEIQRFDEQTRVADLAPAAAAHEAPKLLLRGPPSPRGLFLERAKRAEVALSLDDLLHGGGTEGADQLVLQVRDAHVETERFHVGASEVGAEAASLETAPELVLLGSVTQAGDPEVQPLRAEQVQEAAYRLRTADRNNGDALAAKIPATARGERLERALVADSFHEHDRTRAEARSRCVRWGTNGKSSSGRRPRDVCLAKSLRRIHSPIFAARSSNLRTAACLG